MEKVIGFNEEYKIVENEERGVMYVEQVEEGRRINTIRIDDEAREEWIEEMCKRFNISLETRLVCDVHGHDKWMLEMKRIANGYLLEVSALVRSNNGFVAYYEDGRKCFDEFVKQTKKLTGWDIKYGYESLEP